MRASDILIPKQTSLAKSKKSLNYGFGFVRTWTFYNDNKLKSYLVLKIFLFKLCATIDFFRV